MTTTNEQSANNDTIPQCSKLLLSDSADRMLNARNCSSQLYFQQSPNDHLPQTNEARHTDSHMHTQLVKACNL